MITSRYDFLKSFFSAEIRCRQKVGRVEDVVNSCVAVKYGDSIQGNAHNLRKKARN